MISHFECGTEATDYFRQKDKQLGEVIGKVGHTGREIDTDLFSSIYSARVYSAPAHIAVWQAYMFGLLLEEQS